MKQKYMLYGTKMIEDDSSLHAFAKSIIKTLAADYQISRAECEDDDEYKDKMLDVAYERIHDELSMTDINYGELLERFAKDIGQLLYDMENHGFDLSALRLSFFDNTGENFNALLHNYISIHFEELCLEVNQTILEKVECFKCGHEFEFTKAYIDALGWYTECPKCGSRFGINIEKYLKKTDDAQWCRKIDDKTFHLAEIRRWPEGYIAVSAIIDLDDYSDDEKESIIMGYYPSMEEFKKSYPENEINGLLAECIFESTSEMELSISGPFEKMEDATTEAIKRLVE